MNDSATESTGTHSAWSVGPECGQCLCRVKRRALRVMAQSILDAHEDPSLAPEIIATLTPIARLITQEADA